MIALGTLYRSKNEINELLWKEPITLGTRKGKKFQVDRWLKQRIKRSQKIKGAMLDVEIHPNSALDENWAGRGTEGNENRRLKNESNTVEQGHHFASSTGTFDREEMSEKSDISIENPAVGESPDNNMMHGMTEKAENASLFSERVKNTLEIFFFPFSMETENR